MSFSMFELRFMPHVPAYRPDTVHLFCWIQSAAWLHLPTPSVARQASMPADNVVYFLIETLSKKPTQTHKNGRTSTLRWTPLLRGNLMSRRGGSLRGNPEIHIETQVRIAVPPSLPEFHFEPSVTLPTIHFFLVRRSGRGTRAAVRSRGPLHRIADRRVVDPHPDKANAKLTSSLIPNLIGDPIGWPPVKTITGEQSNPNNAQDRILPRRGKATKGFFAGRKGGAEGGGGRSESSGQGQQFPRLGFEAGGVGVPGRPLPPGGEGREPQEHLRKIVEAKRQGP